MTKIILCVSFLLLCACAKDVNKSSPMGDAGNPVSEDTQGYDQHSLLIFANHSSLDSVNNLYSKYKISGNIQILIPTQISNVSFVDSHPTLVLTKNGSTICQYSWVLNQYQASSSCYSSVKLTLNDNLSILNIPKSQTASLNIFFKKITE